MQIGVSNPNVPIFPPRVCTLVLFINRAVSQQLSCRLNTVNCITSISFNRLTYIYSTFHRLTYVVYLMYLWCRTGMCIKVKTG